MESRSVVCYPQPGKPKSKHVLEAFARGCGGSIAEPGAALLPGAAAFFGCVGIEHLLRLAATEAGREWYYGDNAYLDKARGKFFRFARNELQATRLAAPDHGRLRELGVEVLPWRRAGHHVVVVEQSQHFLSLAGAHPLWTLRAVGELRRHTDRRIVVRHWNPNKTQAQMTLRKDLEGAHALVTYSSAAATEALLAGVPVFVQAEWCTAARMASGPLSNIETPCMPEGREVWAAKLAAMQWTLDELREGIAWRMLREVGG